MKNRTYNLFFHLHTVSGIVISVALFVIFFAGSFSFFRDDIASWERNEAVADSKAISGDYDAMLHVLDSAYALYGRNVTIYRPHAERRNAVYLEATPEEQKRGATPEDNIFLYQDTKTHKYYDYDTSYHLGEFLYRLHFFAQIPYPVGYFLSGFVALFFLFALITGVVVHWDKLVSNFFVFRPKEKLKTLWTDLHTALGTIGLPFQFVYALTGAFFMIKVLVTAPFLYTFYGGDEEAFYDDLGFGHPHPEFVDEKLTAFSVNAVAEKAIAQWPNFELREMHIFNYGSTSMVIQAEGWIPRSEKFTSVGTYVVRVADGQVLQSRSPYEPVTYVEGVFNFLYRVHYGDYGGYGLRFFSFLMGLAGCLVILSGVMIWLKARDKKGLPEKKRRFNEGVVRIYLAICLSMFPVTALSFVVVKLRGASGLEFLYLFYFLAWLLLSLAFILKKDNGFTTRTSLWMGGALGLLVPIVSGLVSGNWFWATAQRNFGAFVVDVLWLALAGSAFFALARMKKKA